MKKLTLACVGSLDQYRSLRSTIRPAVMQHKNNRRVTLGPNVSLHFEDYVTMKYQVQEMMRAENLRSAAAISEELATYNPLIPDGTNLKCTLMLAFPDARERHRALRELLGLEQQIYIGIAGHDAAPAIADEDFVRSTPEKTSAVHFLRFEFSAEARAAAKNGAQWAIYSEHAAYRHRCDPLPAHIASALSRDFS